MIAVAVDLLICIFISAMCAIKPLRGYVIQSFNLVNLLIYQTNIVNKATTLANTNK